MEAQPDQPEHQRQPVWRLVIIFLLVFVSLQWLWKEAAGTGIERFVISTATAGTGASLVNLLTPDVHAEALGSRITAPGGGINILNGCEGTEVLFLLMAALLAYPFTWRMRLYGLLGGTLLVFAANQLRLLALFYSFRANQALFDQLHGLIAPLLLIVIVLGFFILLMRLDERAASRNVPIGTA